MINEYIAEESKIYKFGKFVGYAISLTIFTSLLYFLLLSKLLQQYVEYPIYIAVVLGLYTIISLFKK